LAKKKFHEEEISRGIEQLRQSGLTLDDVSPALVSRLEEQLDKGRETDHNCLLVGQSRRPGGRRGFTED
jgi:hypothetical protein